VVSTVALNGRVFHAWTHPTYLVGGLWEKERVTPVGTHPEPSASRLRRGAAAAAGAALASGLAIYGGVAYASPEAPQPSVGQAQQKLDKLISQDNKLGAQYDAALSSLSSANAKLKQVNSEIGRDQKNFQALHGQVDQIAATAYETGDTTSVSAILTSSNPQNVLQQASMLEHLSGERLSAMQAYVSAAQALRGAQLTAQRYQSAIAQQKDKLEGQKKSLDATVSKQKALVANMTSAVEPGSSGSSTPTGPVPNVAGQAGQAVQFAFAQIGKPYEWGGTGPDAYDCSGLVQAAWQAAGVSIPRDTYGQYASLPHVPQSDIQPGDLLFYEGEDHVAIYVGGGQIIDAPQPGENVEEISMNEQWYSSNFDGAARP
jgi:peptidoglycan DL-endopeptidase CwlO